MEQIEDMFPKLLLIKLKNPIEIGEEEGDIDGQQDIEKKDGANVLMDITIQDLNVFLVNYPV